ncbi:MAG: DNA-directed RNA polymerase subunit beta, partial [Agromyces sp.]
ILHGIFAGDFAGALDRAAAFARVCSAGNIDEAHDADATEPERARELTARASRLTQMSTELLACARMWRAGALD